MSYLQESHTALEDFKTGVISADSIQVSQIFQMFAIDEVMELLLDPGGKRIEDTTLLSSLQGRAWDKTRSWYPMRPKRILNEYWWYTPTIREDAYNLKGIKDPDRRENFIASHEFSHSILNNYINEWMRKFCLIMDHFDNIFRDAAFFDACKSLDKTAISGKAVYTAWEEGICNVLPSEEFMNQTSLGIETSFETFKQDSRDQLNKDLLSKRLLSKKKLNKDGCVAMADKLLFFTKPSNFNNHYNALSSFDFLRGDETPLVIKALFFIYAQDWLLNDVLPLISHLINSHILYGKNGYDLGLFERESYRRKIREASTTWPPNDITLANMEKNPELKSLADSRKEELYLEIEVFETNLRRITGDFDFGFVREVLHEGRSHTDFKKFLKLLSGNVEEDWVKYRAIPYAKGILESWPSSSRVINWATVDPEFLPIASCVDWHKRTCRFKDILKQVSGIEVTNLVVDEAQFLGFLEDLITPLGHSGEIVTGIDTVFEGTSSKKYIKRLKDELEKCDWKVERIIIHPEYYGQCADAIKEIGRSFLQIRKDHPTRILIEKIFNFSQVVIVNSNYRTESLKRICTFEQSYEENGKTIVPLSCWQDHHPNRERVKQQALEDGHFNIFPVWGSSRGIGNSLRTMHIHLSNMFGEGNIFIAAPVAKGYWKRDSFANCANEMIVLKEPFETILDPFECARLNLTKSGDINWLYEHSEIVYRSTIEGY